MLEHAYRSTRLTLAQRFAAGDDALGRAGFRAKASARSIPPSSEPGPPSSEPGPPASEPG
jgi:hypothetical protein